MPRISSACVLGRDDGVDRFWWGTTSLSNLRGSVRLVGSFLVVVVRVLSALVELAGSLRPDLKDIHSP
jgi:hypothetical protein